MEKEMATHSSILAQRILWTEEPGGLLSIGLQSQTRLKQLYFNKARGKNVFTAFILSYFPVFLILIRLYHFTEIPITFILVADF